MLALQVRQNLKLAREMQKELLPTGAAPAPQAPQAVRMGFECSAPSSASDTASASAEWRQTIPCLMTFDTMSHGVLHNGQKAAG